MKQCRDLPGQELFQYIDDDGTHQDVTSQDVNAYLKEITGRGLHREGLPHLVGHGAGGDGAARVREAASVAQAKKNVLQAIEAVAGMLGNTRAVCRKSYIHPAIIDSLHGRLDARAPGDAAATSGRSSSKLRPDEVAVLSILQQRLKKAA